MDHFDGASGVDGPAFVAAGLTTRDQRQDRSKPLSRGQKAVADGAGQPTIPASGVEVALKPRVHLFSQKRRCQPRSARPTAGRRLAPSPLST